MWAIKTLQFTLLFTIMNVCTEPVPVQMEREDRKDARKIVISSEYSDYSTAVSQKGAFQSPLQNKLVHSLQHESLLLSSRDPCPRK